MGSKEAQVEVLLRAILFLLLYCFSSNILGRNILQAHWFCLIFDFASELHQSNAKPAEVTSTSRA